MPGFSIRTGATQAQVCTQRNHSRTNRRLIRQNPLLQQAIPKSTQTDLFRQSPPARVPTPSTLTAFSFVDLFSGIGGLRLGLERVGGRCVFSCERDRYCRETYTAWFGDLPAEDITKIIPDEIPDHDLLAAGFPCQPFSIAGVSKRNSLGRTHGFKDIAQGNLFFTLASIIHAKRPRALLLENVKNLGSHDKGRTWSVVLSTLTDLRYQIFSKIIDAASWVPQHRERVFIIGFDEQIFGSNIPFCFPQLPLGQSQLRSILEASPATKYTLSDHMWWYLRNYAERHRAKGNGFGFSIVPLDGIARTLSARYYKDGSEILVEQEGKNPRRLTPREAARLMGFPDSLPIVVSDTQAYRQFGNAVVPDVVAAVAAQIVCILQRYPS